MFAVSSRRVLPGFTLSLGTSLLFVCLILLLPLSALVMQLAQMSWAQYWEVITNPQVVAAYKVTLLSAFVASITPLPRQLNSNSRPPHRSRRLLSSRASPACLVSYLHTCR